MQKQTRARVSLISEDLHSTFLSCFPIIFCFVNHWPRELESGWKFFHSMRQLCKIFISWNCVSTMSWERRIMGMGGEGKGCVTIATRTFATPYFVTSATPFLVTSTTPFFRTIATRTFATPQNLFLILSNYFRI